jgi:hypothetical protein
VEQPQPRHRDADLRVLERGGELRDRPRGGDRIGIQEDERLAAGLARAQVAAGGEPDVPTGIDDPDALASAGVLDFRPAAAVVDHDDLGDARLPLQGIETARERPARVEGDDDDGCRQ